MKTKKFVSLLLAVAMLMSMMPTTVFAVGTMSVSVNTSAYTEAVEAGTEIAIPVEIDTNPGVAVMDLLVDFDKTIFEFVSMTAGTELVGEYTVGNANSTNCVWVDSQGADNTGTGVFFTITLKVLESASSGATTISIVDQGAFNEAGEEIAVSVVPGTITIAGEEAPLTFADGETTYTFATLKADKYTLTAPGVGYHFAGWFSGLTEDEDGMITLVDGRYILSDKATPDDTAFENVVECRPKYDEAPESGTYNALWIHEDNTETFSSMVLEVYEDSFTYCKATYSDTTKEHLYNNDAIRKAWERAEGNGRVKLVKDMKVADMAADSSTETSVYIDCALKLDMNGRTLTGVEDGETASKTLVFRAGTSGNALESSHGQGRLVQEYVKSGSWNSGVVVDATKTAVSVIRDVDIIGHNTTGRYMRGLSVGVAVIDLIENVNIEVSSTGSYAVPASDCAILSSNLASGGTKIGIIRNCTLKSDGYLIQVDRDNADLGTITGSTMTATGSNVATPIYNDGTITFGAGNTVTAEAEGLFGGSGKLAFTAEGTYRCAESGNALSADVKVTGTPGAGTTVTSENGKLVFVGGFTLQFYNYDGTKLLWSDRYLTGGAPVDHEVTYDIVGLTTYEHQGWSTSLGGTELTDLTTLTADTTLYAVRKEIALSAAVSISVAGGEAMEYASWDNAIASMSSSDYDKDVLIKLLADVQGSTALRAGSYNFTLDLNGHTFTYTGTSKALHQYGGYGKSNIGFTLTSSAAEKGTLILAEGAKGVVANNAYSGTVAPVVISNVRIEAPYLAANTGWNSYGAPISIVNQAQRTETLTMTDVEIVANNCPAVEFSIASTNANCKIDVTFTNVKLSGNPVAVASKGSGTPGATHVTLTVDAASSFKGTAGVHPIQETNGNFGLTLNAPEGYQLIEDTDGWWTYVRPLIIGGTPVNGSTPEVEIPDNGTSVEINNADILGNLESLIVSNANAVLKFLSEALDSIGSQGHSNVTISIEDTTNNGETKRMSFNVKDASGNDVSFTGNVEVTTSFTGIAGKRYAIYHDDNGTLKLVSTNVTADSTDPTKFTATFTVKHFSDYVVAEYTSDFTGELSSSSDTVVNGENVTININVAGANGVTTFSTAVIVITYDPDAMEFVSGMCNVTGLPDNDVVATFTNDTAGTVIIRDYGAAMNVGDNIYSLVFKTIDGGNATVSLSGGISTQAQAETQDLAPVADTEKLVVVNHKVTVNGTDGGSVSPNGDGTYVLTIPDYNGTYNEYTVEATVNGQPVDSSKIIDNGDGTFTIEGVTDDLVVTWSAEVIPFNVTWVDDSNAVVGTKPTTGNMGEDFLFAVKPGEACGELTAGYQYLVTVKDVNGNDVNYTFTTNGDGSTEYTIPYANIPGDITITVTYDEIPATHVSLSTNNSDVKFFLGDQEITDNKVVKGAEVVLKLTVEAGYVYSVTLGDGTNVVLSNDVTEHTISDVQENVVVKVTKTLDTSSVEVSHYLTLNETNMWLVKIGTAQITGKVYTYNGSAMFWSSEYNAYVTLVIAATQPEVSAIVGNFNIVDGSVAEVDYGKDVNMSGTVDINDAQLVWNMYSGKKYTDFTAVSIEKFLRADVNGDGKVDMTDAQTILGEETESTT